MELLQIGLGTRGRQWLEMVQGRTDVTAAGCVASQAGSRDWAAKHAADVPCYESVGEALKHVQADAALIASRPEAHAAHAVEALEAGLAVMIEKPLAPSLADGVQIVEAARRAGRPLMVAQNYRFRRGERALRDCVRAGNVGTITHVSCIDRRDRAPGEHELEQADYVQAFTVAVHHFDTLRSVFEVNPVSVMAQCGQAPWSTYGHGSTTEAFVAMSTNINVHYYGSLTANRAENELRIEGEHGALRLAGQRLWWRKRGSRFFTPMRMPKTTAGEARGEALAGMATLLDQFQAAVQRGETPETHGEDNLWTLAMLEAVRVSDRTGQTAHIADVMTAAGKGQAVSSQPTQEPTP